MTGKKKPILSIINFFICGIGILIFVAIALYPNQRSLDRLDKELLAMTTYIEEQKTLYPLFEELLKISQSGKPGNLPFPEKKPVERSDIGLVSSQIEDIARKNHLDPKEITPDVQTLIDDSDRLRIFVKMRGEFFHLRSFMIGIGAIPHLEHIEQIQLRTLQEESDDLDMSFKIWMASE